MKLYYIVLAIYLINIKYKNEYLATKIFSLFLYETIILIFIVTNILATQNDNYYISIIRHGERMDDNPLEKPNVKLPYDPHLT